MPGPVFANVVLVDEINRTPPRTQAALLEPMEERQATVDGVTHALPAPYLVIATENPIEQHGTYPLPEGQLDRFALSVRVGYPDDAGATALVQRQLRRHPMRDLGAVLEPERVVAAQQAVHDGPRRREGRRRTRSRSRTRRGTRPTSRSGRRRARAVARPLRAGPRGRPRKGLRPARRREGARGAGARASADREGARRRRPRAARSSAGCSTRCRFRCTPRPGGPAVRLRKRAAGLALGAAVVFLMGTNAQAGWLLVLAAMLVGADPRRCCASAGGAARPRGGGRRARRGDAGRGDLRRSATGAPGRGVRWGIRVRDDHLASTETFVDAVRAGERADLTTERVAARRGWHRLGARRGPDVGAVRGGRAPAEAAPSRPRRWWCRRWFRWGRCRSSIPSERPSRRSTRRRAAATGRTTSGSASTAPATRCGTCTGHRPPDTAPSWSGSSRRSARGVCSS